MGGSYTGFQFFQTRSFAEATKASTEPYTQGPYQCAHSQRAPQFMFRDYAAKQQFDAANTTCCGERVTPFQNHPQYADEGKPMTAKRCSEKVGKSTCNQLEIKGSGESSFCAGSPREITDIRVFCPGICEDMATLAEAGELVGSTGTWRFDQQERADEWILAFNPTAADAQDHYDRCLGSKEYTESICDGFEFSYFMNAGLDSPNGCYCDCCGTNGKFAPPSGTIGVPVPGATYANEITLSALTVNTACRTGTMWGSIYHKPSGSSSMAWTVSPAYQSNGSTRLISGQPAAFGDSTHPACCGATIVVSGTDGCGGTQTKTVSLNRAPGSPTFSPAGGTLYTGDQTTITLTGSCNASAYREIDVQGDSCVNTSGWNPPTYSVQGQMSRYLGALALNTDFACRGCCGNGQIGAYYNDGCNLTGTKYWDVRNRPSTASTRVGTVFRAQQVGLNWRVYETSLRCDGAEGTSWTEFSATNYTSQALCNAAFDSASDTVITGACGSSGHCPSAGTCCAYVNNGLTGSSFRAAIFCVNDTDYLTSPTCCTVPYWGGAAWVYNSGGTCCPN